MINNIIVWSFNKYAKVIIFLPVFLFILNLRLYPQDSVNAVNNNIIKKDSIDNKLIKLNYDSVLRIDDISTDRKDYKLKVFFNDTNNTVKLYKLNNYIPSDSLNYLPYDTLLDYFQNYYFQQYRYIPSVSLGNLAKANQYLLPLLNNNNINFGENNFNKFVFSFDNNDYILPRKAYSELFFVLGPKKEQDFNVIYSQNAYKNISFGFNFNNIYSPGVYYNQYSNVANFHFYTKYFTTNKRFEFLTTYVSNKLVVAENGGIVSDSAFENSGQTDRMMLGVNLSNAKNIIRTKGIMMKATYKLNNKKASSYLGYSLLYNKTSAIFRDTLLNIDYYNNIYIDSFRTYDSNFVRTISNKLNIFNNQYHYSKLNYLFDITHNLYNVYQTKLDTNLMNISVDAQLAYKIGKIKAISNFSYIVGGHNQNDYSGIGGFELEKISLPFHVKLKFIGIEVAQTSPQWMTNYYYSNNYIWKNNFNKTSSFNFNFKFSIYNFNISTSYYTINNHIYYDSKSLPAQSQTPIDYVFAEITKKFNIYKFVLDNYFSYSYMITDNATLHLPQVVSKNTFYFNHIFKNGLQFQPGISVFYFSEYYADLYNPVLRQFYFQHQKTIGNYPYIDVFVNLKIKRARIFVKYEHANSGMMKNVYYQVPHYPYNDAAFKLGIAWRFFD